MRRGHACAPPISARWWTRSKGIPQDARRKSWRRGSRRSDRRYASGASSRMAWETVDRAGLWRALTPQVFAMRNCAARLQEAAAGGLAVTDEAQAMERLGIRALLVPGSAFNIKVTRAEDLEMAAAILQDGREQRHANRTGSGRARLRRGRSRRAGRCAHRPCAGHRCALGRRCGDSRVVRRLARRLGRRRHRPALSGQRSALPRRRQPGVSCARWRSACSRQDCAWSTRTSRCSRRRRASARIAAPWRRIWRRTCKLRQPQSTSRQPRPSAWGSSAARRESPRWPQCCCLR